MRPVFTFLIIFSCLSAFSQTTIRYVKSDATGANNGTSWPDAFTKLQDALVAATSGDEIWVAKGSYYPDEGVGRNNNDRNNFFAMKNGVAIYGGFVGTEIQLTQRNWKINPTILSGEIQQDADNTSNSYQVVRNTGIGNTAVLDGFTITDGNGNGGPFQNTGGGMYNITNAFPTVINCTFTQNSAHHGGGMSNVDSSPMLINCVFSENTATSDGGGMLNISSSSPTLINCSFLGNKAAAGGAVDNEFSSSPSFTNCSFSGNSATQWGGGMFNIYTSSPTLINCSFSGNSASSGGGIYNLYSAILTNCILWGDTGGEIVNDDIDGTSTVTYSIIQGGYTGTGNLDKDPLFVDAANDNLRLQGCSPAINTGDNIANSIITDLDGNPRKVGVIDMGAYEYQGSAFAGSIAYVRYNATGTNDGTSWTNAFNKLQDALALANSCSIVTQVWVAKGTYYADEGTGQTNDARSSSFLLKNGVAIYGGFAGNETQLSQRNWQSNVTILSGDLQQNDGASFTGNDENAYHVVRGNSGVNNTAVLDGFTVTAGNANVLDGINNNGAGVYNVSSSPRLFNCSFSGNSASSSGGGIFNNSSSPYLTNCSFSGNSASAGGGGVFNVSSSPYLVNCSFSKNTGPGGGMCNSASSPTLTSCIFSENKSPNFGGGIINSASSLPTLTNCSFVGNTANIYGGGIYSKNSSPTITNCSFVGNSASSGGGVNNEYSSSNIINCTFFGNSGTGGGILNYSSSPTVANCILWGDTGGEILNEAGSTLVVTYSIVQGGYAGTGNKGTDPLFVNAATGNVRLQACSPAIDAGNDAANDTTADLDNNTRKVDAVNGGSKIDMGAYEFQGDLDADNDGYAYCNNEDCNDNNAAINVPSTWVLDKDQDGYYTGSLKVQCTSPGTGYVVKTTQQTGDCNDNDPTVNPGAVEVCGNGKNDNCNNTTDEQPCYACRNATSFSTTNITCNSAILNWVSIPHPEQWQVQYKTTATGSKWKDVVLTGNKRSITVTGLAANQNYNWHIRAKCGKSWTDYSVAISFKTLKTCTTNSLNILSSVRSTDVSSERLNETINGTLQLYPNPSHGQFMVNLRVDDNSTGTTRIQLIDISGRTMQTESAVLYNGTLQKTIHVSPALANGIYMVRITTATGTVYNRKLVLEKR